MKDPLSRFPGYSLRRAANAAAAELADRLSALGLRQSEVSVLMLVDANPRMTASAIGRQLDIQRANMVPLLKRLEARELVERHAIDGKSMGLVLTKEGKQTCDKAIAIVEAFEAGLVARVPQEHRDHLLPALNALWNAEDEEGEEE